MSGDSAPRAPVSLRQLAKVFAEVGALGFGGGMAMLALMRERVVNRCQWLREEEFATAVAIGQLTPGPFIPHVAQYIGNRLRGFKGMIVATTAFVMPSVLVILVLSIVYFRYGSLPAVQTAFRGVAPVVFGILVFAFGQMGRAAVRSWRAALIALIAFCALLLRIDVLATILGCGALGILLSGRIPPPKTMGFLPWFCAPWFVPGAYALSSAAGNGFWDIVKQSARLFGVFAKIGTIIWGGGFAAIPFIKNEVVDARTWLTAREFIDGVALGQITPGPVAITATFVGYRVLGILGAGLATLGMFLPSFLILLVVLRAYDRVKDLYLVKGFLSGILPAIVGMLLSAAYFIGRESITGLVTGSLAIISLILLICVRLDPVWLVFGGALAGIVFGRFL